MINARILVRKGLKSDFDPTKMLPGEWAVSIDASTSNQIVWMCFAPGVCKRMGTYEDFKSMISQANGEIIEELRGEFEAILSEVQSLSETVSANTDVVLVAKSDIVDTYLPQIEAYAESASASEINSKRFAESAKTSEEYVRTVYDELKDVVIDVQRVVEAEENAIKASENAESFSQEASSNASSAKTYAQTAGNHSVTAGEKASEASASANLATLKANDASESAIMSQSYAVGGTGKRENEDADNARYYMEQAERISQGLAGALLPMGTITFSQLSLQQKIAGYMYNISDSFVTDERFKEGAGFSYPEGTNVYYTADGYWDCIAGTNVVGVKGSAESSYRKGNVNITKVNIGLGNVDNTSDANKPISTAQQAALNLKLEKTGDSANNTVTFSSGDVVNPTGWADINVVETGENHGSLFRKLSLAIKNLRYLFNILGTSDISTVGDGTVRGAINSLNGSLFAENPFTHGGRKAVAIASTLHDMDKLHLLQFKYYEDDSYGNGRTDFYLDNAKVGELGYALNRDQNNGGNRIANIGMDDGGVYLTVDGNKHHIQLTD